MTADRALRMSERWFRLLLYLYPVDFRDVIGDGIVAAYRDRAHVALARGGTWRLLRLWVRAFVDALRNGLSERARPAASWRRPGLWGRDLERVVRRLVRAPVSTAAIVATLAVGMATFIVSFTAVEKTLIEPLPYANPGDLYVVWRDYRAAFDLTHATLTGPDIAALQQAGGVIEGAVGVRQVPAALSLRDGADPTDVFVMVSSPSFFDLLGVEPALGRTFAPGESGPAKPASVVLSFALWRTLGADPRILGTTVWMDGQPFTVIGVMPARFASVENGPRGSKPLAAAYITYRANVALADQNPGLGTYVGVIRVRHGTPASTVAGAVDAIGHEMDRRHFASRGMKLYVVGLQADLVTSVRPALVALAIAGACLSGVLFVNLASVLLGRVAAREHELAVSCALGANRVAVVRAMLLEGGVLGFLGGSVGVAAAIWGTRVFVALAPLDLPRRDAIAVDWRIGLGGVALTVFLGVLAALAPAIWAARLSVSSRLASGVRGSGPGRVRRSLVAVQVALLLVLLSAGGLVIRGVAGVLAADPGFRPGGVLTLRVPIPPQLFPTPAARLGLEDRIEHALADVPGVTGVSAVSATPFSAPAFETPVAIPGAPGTAGDAGQNETLVDFIGARAGYVDVMGLEVVAGRALGPVRQDGVHEALIDRALATRLFPASAPLGATILFSRQRLTVVGVVKPTHMDSSDEDRHPQLFVRADDWGMDTPFIVLRADRAAQALIPDVREAIHHVDSRLSAADVRTMSEIVGDALRPPRLSVALILALAIGALVLAAMGLSAIIAGSVTERRHEFAVRLALGADHRRVLRVMLGESARLVGAGILLGVPGIILTGRVMRGVPLGESRADLLTLAAVAFGLVVVTIGACYVPARRVLGIDPAQALRQD